MSITLFLFVLAFSTQAQGLSAETALADKKADALLLYRQGRDLESSGKMDEAKARYLAAVQICETEIATDPKRMDAYAVKCWSLFRLGRHGEVVELGSVALKIMFDARVSEVMGESYFHLGKNELSLKYLQKYIESSGESADRVPTAYFYMGETYLRMKHLAHADIAYSFAVAREPNMPRWWYRLGQVCESLGEWKRAYDAYNRALVLSPALQEAIDGRDRVKPKTGA